MNVINNLAKQRIICVIILGLGIFILDTNSTEIMANIILNTKKRDIRKKLHAEYIIGIMRATLVVVNPS